VLLATEGRAIPAAAVDRAAELAHESGGGVHVFSIARVWGTSFGFPNPGLQPTRQEWKDQRDLIENTVKALEKRGVDATGRVLGDAQGDQAHRRRSGAARLHCDRDGG